jgi:hypothetical protein
VRAPIRWAVTIAVLLAVTIGAFVPILFALARTPLHDGDELPGRGLLGATLLSSAALGAVAAALVRRLLRGRGRGDAP